MIIRFFNFILSGLVAHFKKNLTIWIITTVGGVIGGSGYFKINDKLNHLQSSVILPSKQTSEPIFQIEKEINTMLVDCKTKGIFSGWILVAKVYNTPDGKCGINQNCEFLYYSAYFQSLFGVWNTLGISANTKKSNLYYERTDLKIDIKSIEYFNIYNGRVVMLTEKIAKLHNLDFVKEVYDNLNLKQWDLTLEEIYIKPVIYSQNLIWIFTLSFQNLEEAKRGNCYDERQTSQRVFLENLSTHARLQYGIGANY